ncbi:unnamed protein product [Paramecium sonneborni]|uniref:Uncharacterized protein n=1 Tax=Paramecium sonneborni TaxID=65129 RepID=A0A8S1RQ59_9CILI|nr:unnamed protein product [Paramecium sonneborni]
MILLVVLVYGTQQTLIYQFDASSNIRDGNFGSFTFIFQDGKIVIVNSILAGGFIILEHLLINLSLAEYFQIQNLILMLKWMQNFLGNYFLNNKSIDTNISPNFLIDQQSQTYNVLVNSSQICGEIQPEYIHTIQITWQHNRRTVWIYIDFEKGGLISLSLSIIKCQYECAGCIDNYHIFCTQWKLHQYQFNQKFITNFEGWTFESQYRITSSFNCGNCEYLSFLEIKYFTQLPPHQDVLIRMFKQNFGPIIVNYLYGISQYSSRQIEILIKNHHDLILLIYIKSTTSGFRNLRDFEVFYTQPENIYKDLNEGCLEQINDSCLICQEGWIQDEFLENCHPICGDGIIQGQEECDDGNLISSDSCYLCQYSCIDYCQICQFGICLQCQDGFIINSNFNCDPFCGDGNLTPYSTEQCEMTVNGVLDGCQDCRFISIANCKINYFSICLKCETGYYMLENICFPNCGDRLILELYEDCDDGNLQPYDGCFECKFQCIEDCNICDRGKCILKCEEGYEFVNNTCLSVCGDLLVAKEEDCDDGNTQPYDGCFDCKYSCPENCNDCYQGICLECNYQQQLIISNQCKQQLHCGDGLLQEQEECDDENYQPVDGCNDCLIEKNWICITITKDSFSQCAFLKAPNLIINYLNMTQNKQYISIEFDQQVKIQTAQPLSETINFQLSNIDKNYWNSVLYIIQDVGSDINFVEFIVQIEANLNNLNKSNDYQY